MHLQQIAERCQQGDRDAFALLYTASHDRLRSLCLRYVGSETVADDLLHDAFVLILTRIGELKHTERVEAWMQRVVRNVALVYLRQQKQWRQVPVEAAEAVPAASSSALAYDELLSVVNALPDGYRQVFRLSVFEGMSHQQIAALLGIEPHSSSSQLFRARMLLRRWLRPVLLLVVVIGASYFLLSPKEARHGLPRSSSATVSHGSARSSSATDDHGLPRTSATVSHGSSRSSATDDHEVEQTKNKGEEGRHGRCLSVPVTQHCCVIEDRRETIAQKEDHDGPSKPVEKENREKPWETVAKKEDREEPWKTVAEDGRGWGMAVAYSGMSNGGPGRLPYGDGSTSETTYDSISHHRLPLTVALSLRYGLDRHWQVGVGVQYTRLTSELLSGNTYVSLQQHQTVQYFGLPVSLSWRTQLLPRLDGYASASVSVQLPLRSTLSSHYLLPGGTVAEPTTERLHPGVQWSAGVGLGVQYNLGPHVSFFVEPSLQHYFRNGSTVSTWNTEHPFVLSVPFGLRISF